MQRVDLREGFFFLFVPLLFFSHCKVSLIFAYVQHGFFFCMRLVLSQDPYCTILGFFFFTVQSAPYVIIHITDNHCHCQAIYSSTLRSTLIRQALNLLVSTSAKSANHHKLEQLKLRILDCVRKLLVTPIHNDPAEKSC